MFLLSLLNRLRALPLVLGVPAFSVTQRPGTPAREQKNY
jgi:hypothetical protein